MHNTHWLKPANPVPAFELMYEGAISQPRWTKSFCGPPVPINIANLPEYDDLVVASLVVFDEELGGAELVRIHRAQQHLLQRLHRQIFSANNKASHQRGGGSRSGRRMC